MNNIAPRPTEKLRRPGWAPAILVCLCITPIRTMPLAAEDGYDLWLRYRPVEGPIRGQEYRRTATALVVLTANGVSLYFSLKNDPATKAIADDTEHQLLAKGLASTSPMSGLTLNAMVFKHSPYPNAAKAFLQFMLEKEQYEPWLNANSGYWSQPLVAYADAAVWSGDPKVAIFRNTMKSPYYNGYKGPISTATGAVTADYVLVQMCASLATDAATPEAAAAEAEQRAKRYFRRQNR